ARREQEARSDGARSPPGRSATGDRAGVLRGAHANGDRAASRRPARDREDADPGGARAATRSLCLDGECYVMSHEAYVELAPGYERWRPRLLWPVRAGASLAAAAAVLVYLGLTVGELRREMRAGSEEAATLRAEVARQRELLALLGAPETHAVALAGLAPS